MKALKEIDNSGIPSRRQSNIYDIIYEGKSYPPPLAIEYAYNIATGEELDIGYKAFVIG